MQRSDGIAKIADALAKFQGEVSDPAKNSDNPFFKSKYVELDGLLQAIRPVLSKHGLSFVQSPGGDGQAITITTLLMHTSGEWIEFEPLTLKAVKTDPQGAGSAITYGRRYSLSAILGIAWDADDDGNKASGKGQKNDAPKESSSEPSKKSDFQKAQQEVGKMRQEEKHSSNESINWKSFWGSVKTFNLDESAVVEIAADHFKTNFNSLTELIHTQQELNKFLSICAKHKKAS